MTDKANPHMEREPPDDLGSTEIGRVGVVGVGASAAVSKHSANSSGALPSDTGKAFVLVSHLAPEHTSAMATILQRATAMPVVEVIDGVAVEPNRVYVIPPGRLLSISGGTLELASRDSAAHPRVVDQFFESLADDLRNSAIGVVLSGTANDGTQGLESIKAVGGTTFAQDDSAQFDGMPHSAIESGCVDFVLPPDLIAREIARLSFRDQLDPDDPSAANADGRHLPERNTGTAAAHQRYRLHRLQIQHTAADACGGGCGSSRSTRSPITSFRCGDSQRRLRRYTTTY
jgi:two-component system CheB/CheR fusion protein